VKISKPSTDFWVTVCAVCLVYLLILVGVVQRAFHFVVQHKNIVLTILAIVYVPLVVWLGVRIVNLRERWAKRLAVFLVVATVLYPLSIGPACWISSHANTGGEVVSVVYLPILWIAFDFTQLTRPPAQEALLHYTQFVAVEGWDWIYDGRGRPIWRNPDVKPYW